MGCHSEKNHESKPPQPHKAPKTWHFHSGYLMQNCKRSKRHHAEPIPIRQSDSLRFVEQNGLAGFDGEHAAAGFVKRFDGLLTDGGDVEAAILLWLGHLDDHEAARPAQFAG